jgi:hypothetical protein
VVSPYSSIQSKADPLRVKQRYQKLVFVSEEKDPDPGLESIPIGFRKGSDPKKRKKCLSW